MNLSLDPAPDPALLTDSRWTDLSNRVINLEIQSTLRQEPPSLQSPGQEHTRLINLEANTGAHYGSGIFSTRSSSSASSPALNLPNELWAAKTEIEALKNDILVLKAEVIRLANPSPLPSMGSQPSAPISVQSGSVSEVSATGPTITPRRFSLP